MRFGCATALDRVGGEHDGARWDSHLALLGVAVCGCCFNISGEQRDRSGLVFDACVTCPECGAWWAIRAKVEEKPQVKWQFVPRNVKAWRWWSAARLIDDQGGVREFLDPSAKAGSEARRKIPQDGEMRLLVLVQAGCLVLLFGLMFLYEYLDQWVPALKFRAEDDLGMMMMRFLARGVAALPLMALLAGNLVWMLRVELPRSTARLRLACGLCGACGTETVLADEAGVRVCPQCEGAWRLKEEGAG